MNKYIKYMAIIAIAAVGFASQADAASVSLRLGNGVFLSVRDGKQKPAKRRMAQDMRHRHHLDHCRDCRREARRRAHISRHAYHKHHR